MKHICTVDFEEYTFGISVDESIDNPGMFRLVCDEDGQEIDDMFETAEEAVRAIDILYSMYPVNWEIDE